MGVLCPRIIEQVKKISNDELSPAAWFKIFQRVDENNSGTISRDEFIRMIRNFLDISEEDMFDEEINTIWSVADSSRDGIVKLSEFVDFLNNRWAASLDVKLKYEDVKNQVVTTSKFHIPTHDELERCEEARKTGVWSGLRMAVWARRHDKARSR